MTANVVWSDDFSHNYFADSTYSLFSPGHFTVAANALTATPYEVFWQDQRASIPSGFTVAKVWADIAAVSDAGLMELLVGFHHAPTILSLAIEPNAGWDETRVDGVDGGPIMSGANRVLELNVWSGNVDTGPESPARSVITTGRVELTLYANGTVVVTSPDGSTSTTTVPADTLVTWLGESGSLHPQVLCVPNNAAGHPTVLSAWGYEIDYPTPPSITPGIVSAGHVRIGF